MKKALPSLLSIWGTAAILAVGMYYDAAWMGPLIVAGGLTCVGCIGKYLADVS